jgi:hypothetical protein
MDRHLLKMMKVPVMELLQSPVSEQAQAVTPASHGFSGRCVR